MKCSRCEDGQTEFPTKSRELPQVTNISRVAWFEISWSLTTANVKTVQKLPNDDNQGHGFNGMVE